MMSNVDKEAAVLTKASISITQKNPGDYLIPLENSKFHTIILHVTNARPILKRGEVIRDITDSLLSLPPTYALRKIFRFTFVPFDEQFAHYDGIVIRAATSKSRVNVYQIAEEELEVSLST
jgi:hypothetical protein